TLKNLMKQIPQHEMPMMRMAEAHDAFGDLHVAWGKTYQAKHHYSEAVKLYPQAKPKYGQHLLPRRAKKVQAKLDLLSYDSLASAQLKDGRYQGRALGYSGDIDLTIVVRNGKLHDISLKHQEKIDQNACVIIPRRIVDTQSLRVDGITGATITKDAIVGGTFRTLKKAGLK
ncbi:MAG: FMN-binding protein, partial [Pirellulales bacterium]|nr:FMN-binding protein [Pirellulales bacterium]